MPQQLNPKTARKLIPNYDEFPNIHKHGSLQRMVVDDGWEMQNCILIGDRIYHIDLPDPEPGQSYIIVGDDNKWYYAGNTIIESIDEAVASVRANHAEALNIELYVYALAKEQPMQTY